MKKYLFLFIALVAMQISAQEPCGFEEYNRSVQRVFPNGFENNSTPRGERTNNTHFVIPVVFHLMGTDLVERYKGETATTLLEFSIESYINALNTYFTLIPSKYYISILFGENKSSKWL